MHLIPSISIALALAGTAQAAAPASETAAPTRESAEAAVLECHQQYALRYATHVDAAPSEIAAGAFSGCKQQMDAFEALAPRSEEHTSELQALMRHSYAVFCL